MENLYTQAMESVQQRLVGKTPRARLKFIGELQGGRLTPKMDHLVCFLSGALALGAANGLGGGMSGSHMQLAKDLGKTCNEMYTSTKTGLAPEIAYFITGSNFLLSLLFFSFG